MTMQSSGDNYSTRAIQSRKQRTRINAGLAITLGIFAASTSIIAGNLSAKYIVALVFSCFCLVIAIGLRSSLRLNSLLTILLALTIPINMDVNFLYRLHVGGAPGITITASILLLISMFIVMWYRYLVNLQTPLLQYNKMLLWAPLIYMAVGVMSLMNAAYPDLVILGLVRQFSVYLGLIIVMNLRSYAEIKYFVFFLSVGVLLQATLAIIQYASGSSLGLEIFGEQSLVSQNIGHVASRATATVGHPNILGYFFEITLPIIFALFLLKQPVAHRLWYLGVFIAGLAGIGTTLSRGAWISLPVGLMIVFFVLYRKKLFRMNTAVGMFLAGCMLLAGLYFAFPTIEKRFTHDDYKSSASRMPLNIAAFSIIRQYPVFGIGLNNFSEVFKRYDTTGKSRIFKGYKHVVHNLYLFVWTEIGTVGLLAFFWIFISAFLLARQTYQRAPPWSRHVLVGIVAGLTSHLIHGMVDPGFKVTLNITMLIFCLIGLIGAIHLLERATDSPASSHGSKSRRITVRAAS